MRTMKTGMAALAIVALASLAGCGTEVGRVPLSGVGTASVTVPLKAGDVVFWTDIDIAYEGDAALRYDVELSQGGTVVAKATCDPLGLIHVKSSWIETNVGASHTRRGNGKMTCSATLPKESPTLVSVTLAFGKSPGTVTLRKADLVLKQ